MLIKVSLVKTYWSEDGQLLLKWISLDEIFSRYLIKNDIPEIRTQPGGPGINKTLRKLGPEDFNLFTWTPGGSIVSH